ncbi:MAG: MliC family protein [Gemmatimonadales bacterium]|nr:MliC family protein [Gemmatimonadales bacterium]
MRILIAVLVLGGAACSAGAPPESTPAPRPDVAVTPPPPTDAERAPPPPVAEPDRAKPWRGAVTYRCAGDRMIETVYADDGTVEVRWNGRWYTLRPQQAASGALYANSSLRWHTRGDAASLEERGRTVASDCAVRSRGSN